ncbi:MAG: KpsF/GutQ family sugar-phosphate isomerase [Oligoflexales bacterium]|nr:KpsF/GutQ family sugar-phosphate isomerase [Oligoflexales bacterium]
MQKNEEIRSISGGAVLGNGTFEAGSLCEDEVLSWGKEVIHKEVKAIHAAGERLDLSFSSAVKLILSCSGKVVVTALGKSGHVAAKIAATLSSTGTPATFLHASEALHGDFGMINHNDMLLAIAFGGETREVVAVCKFARRFGLKVVGITGKLQSSLAQLTDEVLDASIPHEADALGLAPTSSTSVSLALGDALAVALMKARGFKEEHFAQLHPGGSLGKALVRVEELMHKSTAISVVDANADFHSVLEAVTSPNFGIVAVVNKDGLVEGSVTDGDLRRALLKSGGKALDLRAADLMNACPKTVSPDLKAVEVIGLMERYKITSLFVTDTHDKLLGLVRLHDLLAAKIV